jgi:hypothetical protein
MADKISKGMKEDYTSVPPELSAKKQSQPVPKPKRKPEPPMKKKAGGYMKKMGGGYMKKMKKGGKTGKYTCSHNRLY